jgi:5-formyltetrahydrofolate cyclo-ligase
MPKYALGMMILASVLFGISLTWQTIASSFANLLLFALCAFVVQLIVLILSRRFPIRERIIGKRVYFWLLAGLFFFSLWEAALLSHYPGFVFGDSLDIIKQSALDTVFTNQPPFLYKLLLSIPLAIATKFNNPDAGIAVFLTIQIAFMSGIVGYVFVWLRRKNCPIWLLSVAVLCLGINPLVISYVIALSAVAPFAGCVLLLVMMLYDSMRNQASALRDAYTLFKLVCLCGVLVLLKSSAVIIAVPVLIFLILYVKEHRIALIVSSVIAVALCFLVTGAALFVFNPATGKFATAVDGVEGISSIIPFFYAPPAFGEINSGGYWDLFLSNSALPSSYAGGYQPVNLFETLLGVPLFAVDLLGASNYLQSLPIIGLLNNGAFLLWLTVMGFTVTLANRPARYCIVYLLLLLVWVTGVLTNYASNEMRILFALYMSMPIIMLTPVAKSMEENKSELRCSLAQKRTNILPIDRVAGEQKVAAKVLDLVSTNVAPGSYIAVYSAFRTEMDLEELQTALVQRGYNIVFPAVYSDELMAFVNFVEEDAHSLTAVLLRAKPGTIVSSKALKKFKLIPPNKISAFIVPGLGFDVDARRLGYGGGFYDRYIKRVKNNVPIWGVAFDEQIVDEIPAASFDIPMTAVITPTRYFVPE